MPLYEYVCQGCGHRFEKLVRSTAGEQPDVICPLCRDERSQRVLSSFAVSRQGSSAALANAPAPIGGG